MTLQDERTAPKRPLVVRFGSMGDMVIALALIEALHERFGTRVDVVSSGEWTHALFESQPGVGNLYRIRSRKTPYTLSPQQWQLVHTLRDRGPSPTWLCDSQDKCRWLIARAGIPDSHIVDARSFPRLPHEHAVDRWLRFAQASPPVLSDSGVAPVDGARLRVPPLQLNPQWRGDVDRWLRVYGLVEHPLILVQPGSRRTTKWGRPHKRPSNTKYWPAHRWAQVIDSIALSEPAARILLTGIASEYRLNQAILQLTKTDRALNVADDLPLQRLLAVQERAIGMISVDTGPAHSAAALGCPLVVLFGIADVEEYLPRSPNDAVVCLRGRDRRRECMLDISVDDVVDAWHTLSNAHARRLHALKLIRQPVVLHAAHLIEFDIPRETATSSGLRSPPGP